MTAKKKPEPTAGIARMTCNGGELAVLLGTTPAIISQWKKEGKIRPDSHGRYAVAKTVSELYRRAKAEARAPRRDAADDELKYWKTENEKARNLEWRRRLAADIATAVVLRVQDEAAAVRDAIAAGEGARQAVEALIARLDSVDPDSVALDAEGEEAADEED